MRVGIDLGGSHIAIGVVNENNGEIIEKVERDLQKQNNIEKVIKDYLLLNLEFFIHKYNINLIGIASPGNPNQKELSIYNLVNLGIKKLDLKYILEKYNIPIKLENDAKAAGLAEFTYGALKNYNDAVFLCLGTGIGSAVFLNGKLIKANKHTGFELGHMIIDRKGLECNCGKRGCFETYCSIKRFKENVIKLLKLDNTEPKTLIEKLKKETENNEIKNLINEYVNNLIVGLSNIIDIFEPESIALGGSFVFFKDLLYNKLVKEMEERKYVFNKESLPKILLADLKNDAGIIGAVLD